MLCINYLNQFERFSVRVATHIQLPDDGSCAPAVVQRDVSQVAVGVVTEIQDGLAAPALQTLQLSQVPLRSSGVTLQNLTDKFLYFFCTA